MISPEIFFDNTNNYGIVKTETVFGFSPKRSFTNINSTAPIHWMVTPGNLRRAFTENPTKQTKQRTQKSNKKQKSLGKGHKKKHSKIKKCIYKLLKKKKKKSKHLHMMKKYMLPLIIGLVAAKSILIPVAFKAFALLSFKALLFLSILKLLK
ncbi:uncharacterized protein LOC128199453 [Bicyclus anynana]|uniref:Uncharacterized protein LOC128199453 n=1 Tax=Bicyclus anynana TaxID=110368 RepID=A0ABM3M273_BICAN|nr:uncharacterized protein LOC128199453 [Bicyclus anynana]